MQFAYTALTAAGQKVGGMVDAETEAQALRSLEEKNLFPVSVAAKGAQKTARAKKGKGVRSRDVGTMYSQLADLIGSGVPLLRALDTLIKSTPNANLVVVLREIRGAVADGKSLNESMKQFPEIFPTLHTSMVQAGERASMLETVLTSLASFIERLDELRSKVIGAMIYPMLLVAVGMAVMVGALVFFVPKFEPLLANVQQALPTKLIFTLSIILRSYWHFVAIALVIAVFAALSVFKSPHAKRVAERWRMKIPVVGGALRMVAITRFCRILGTMLTNGVPLLQAMNIAKGATGSTLMADRIAEAAESVREGKSLTAPLGVGGLFPEQILAMLSVAEESNQLEKVLLQIADTVERRTNREVDQAVRLVEPLILCLVAAGIGFLALGLLLPIFTMASSLGKS
ncbi:MAG TPA: type II secretion system F family protein [Candidatus Kapabacteria bacterium]|jgi:general secretion pathway protein F|nr:type II secretion system F family protein [Candidatus Kapabacteria bacterium]